MTSPSRLLLLAVAACSSSATSSPDVAPPSNTCGPGPYVHVHTGALSYTTHLPLAGAIATASDACPDRQFVSDDTGFWDIEMTDGLAFDPRIVASGYITSRTGQSTTHSDLELGANNLFFPTTVEATWFPHLTASTPALLAVAFLAPGTQTNPSDPCSTRDGVTFAVTGHPEATIVYYGGTSQQPTPNPSLTATTSIGAAEVSGVAASNGAEIELTATKATCPISFQSYPHTGKYTLEDGVLSLAGAFMPPISAP